MTSDVKHICTSFNRSLKPIVLIPKSVILCRSGFSVTVTETDLIVLESSFNISSDKVSSDYLFIINSLSLVNTLNLENTLITFTVLDYEIKYIAVMALYVDRWKIKDT